MGGYTAQDMIPPSWLVSTGLAAAAQSDGTLLAVFNIQMPSPAAAYPVDAFPFLYAFGPLDSHGSPDIHPVSAQPPAETLLVLFAASGSTST